VRRIEQLSSWRGPQGFRELLPREGGWIPATTLPLRTSSTPCGPPCSSTPECEAGVPEPAASRPPHHGLGPNFVAARPPSVVEPAGASDSAPSSRRVAAPLAGEPRTTAGHARDRFVYAPGAGMFRRPQPSASGSGRPGGATLTGRPRRPLSTASCAASRMTGSSVEQGTNASRSTPRRHPARGPARRAPRCDRRAVVRAIRASRSVRSPGPT